MIYLSLVHDVFIVSLCFHVSTKTYLLPFFKITFLRLPITNFISLFLKCSLAAGPLEKPEPVKTHLRNMLILPEMCGSVVAVYNGKVFNLVEIKPEMVGYYLAEFSISYRSVRHGRPGIGSNNSSRFIPLK